MIKSLEESEEKFRAIARSANDAIITIDGDGTCLFYNEAAVRMFSCPPDAFIGKNISLIVPEGSQELHKLGLMKFNETGAGNILGKTVEVMARRMDGSEFPVELVVSGFQMKGKWHATGILRDITERRKWAASLEESNAKLKEAMRRLETTQRLLIRNEKLSAVGQLSAGVAHELKNPLSIISMSVELLQMDTYPAGDRAKTHKTIMEQVRRSAKIIDNLRDFSRERKPEVKVLDVRDLLGKTLELVEYEMRVEGIEINKKIDPALPRINGDPDQLAQVFLNIISNTRDSLNDKRKAVLAGKYGNISWEGVMNVGAWSDGGSISIRFEDNGDGISSENLPRVFDPFFTTKEEGKGTGLGLGIAYGIIQGHGGSIVMESEEGRNAITTVILPAIIK
jgi:PAS domain S-box-containing protein